MPKVNEMIQSKFLRKEDFEEDQICTIKDVRLEEMQGNASETRWVLYFKERPKAMVLNTTTIRVLEAAFGDDSDNWLGKRVKVYVDPTVSFQGRVVGGLRLMPPRKGGNGTPASAPVATPNPPRVPAADAEFDDQVPF